MDNRRGVEVSEDLLSFGRRILAGQPFSALLAASLDALEAGHVEMRVPVAPALLQRHGFVHGGVISYLADNALAFAGGSVLGDGVTSEFKINYLRPAKEADALLALATVLVSGRTQAVVRCDVYTVHGTQRRLVAAAQGTITKVP
jgi:uncharacterized protein (TIGR00369 family)